VKEPNLTTLTDNIIRIIPRINDWGNKKGASVTRCMITLYAASYITSFREKGLPLGGLRYFSPYALSQIAGDSENIFGIKIKFDKGRTSIHKYEECEIKEYTKFLPKEELSKIRPKNSNVRGTKYLAITERGSEYCEEVLRELLYSEQRQRIEIDKDKNDLLSRTSEVIDSINESKFKSNSFEMMTQRPQVFKGQKTIFVERKDGRKKQIRELKRIMRKGSGPISLVGEGGIGKSSLAFRLINYCRHLYNYIIPIYLEQGASFESFISEISRRLGIYSNEFCKENLEIRRQILLEALARAKHPLIFLDNYETISEVSENDSIPDDTMKINGFLESIPSNTQIILTSRYKSNFLGEYINYVPGLTKDEGVDLFIQISSRYFAKKPSENIIKEIKKICSELGGHPLSIKLLAGSYQGGGISELQDIVRNTLNITNKMDEQVRLRSINNCFSYSFGRLSDKSKKLLLDLCLFKSPFLNSAVNYIFFADEKEFFDLFNRCFILQIDIEDNLNFDTPHKLFGFHPIIKKYLRERSNEKRLFLQTDLSEAFRLYYSILLAKIYDMLFELYFGVVSHYYGVVSKSDLPLLKTFNLIMSHPENDFEQAIELTTNLKSKSFLVSRLSKILSLQGLFNASIYYTRKLLEIDVGIGDSMRIVRDYIELGIAFAEVNDLERSLEYNQKALDLLIPLKQKEHLHVVYTNIGNIYRIKGDPDKALEYHTKAFNVERNALVYSNIASDLFDKGDIKDALLYHRMVLRFDKKTNDIFGMAIDYSNLGIIIFKMGDVNKGLQYHNRALELYQQMDNKKGLATQCENIAEILEFTGDTKKSREYKEKAQNLRLSIAQIDTMYTNNDR
jgi:tetratricopeptide (TPR) repeat protein